MPLKTSLDFSVLNNCLLNFVVSHNFMSCQLLENLNCFQNTKRTVDRHTQDADYDSVELTLVLGVLSSGS